LGHGGDFQERARRHCPKLRESMVKPMPESIAVHKKPTSLPAFKSPVKATRQREREAQDHIRSSIGERGRG